MSMKMSNLEKRFVNNAGHARQVSKHAIKLLNRIPLQHDMRFLDVGTGTGATPIRVAQTYGLHSTGVDVDPEQIALAKLQILNLEQVRFVAADATDLPFPDATYDIVSTAKMTHHIPDWPAAIAEMLRVLKPGGYLVYNDIALPQWLAQAAARMTNRSLPPTPYQLDKVVSEYELTTIYRSRIALSYTAIWRKKEID